MGMLDSIPLHLRLYMEMLGGKDSPVDNSYFSDQEIMAMANLFNESVRNSEKEYNNLLEKQKYLQTVLNSTTTLDKKYSPEELTAKLDERVAIRKELEDITNKLQSYQNTADRSSVDYLDYRDASGANLNDANRTASKVFSNNPYDTVMNSIGQFKGQLNPDGSVSINDIYSMDLDRSSLESAQGMRDYAEILAKELRPDYKRNINVTIPAEFIDVNTTGFEPTIK